MEKLSTVCVTGATGYIGSWLVRKLLQRGYMVHATIRNLGDETKVQVLKKLDGADERLRLFEADLYDAEKFELAINGCDFVFLVATPIFHTPNSKYKDTTEASLAALQIIMGACEKSESVKRVIYTASVMSASPRKEEDFSFKNSIDESCWTPLHCPFANAQEFELRGLHIAYKQPKAFSPDNVELFLNTLPPVQDYIRSKTLTEKEFLSYNTKGNKKGMEVVSLVCALVGGNAILQYVPGSMSVVISPLNGQILLYKFLKLLQEMIGSVPLVHIDDVCEAHIFCMENEFISGRFLCVSHWPTIQGIVDYYELKFPNVQVLKEVEGGKSGIPYNISKLLDFGFKYKYNLEHILDDSIEHARRVGGLTNLL